MGRALYLCPLLHSLLVFTSLAELQSELEDNAVEGRKRRRRESAQQWTSINQNTLLGFLCNRCQNGAPYGQPPTAARYTGGRVNFQSLNCQSVGSWNVPGSITVPYGPATSADIEALGGGNCIYPRVVLARNNAAFGVMNAQGATARNGLCECLYNLITQCQNSPNQHDCVDSKICNCPDVCPQFKASIGCGTSLLSNNSAPASESSQKSSQKIMARRQRQSVAASGAIETDQAWVAQNSLDSSLSGKCID